MREVGFCVADESLTTRYHRYCGDFLELGKGEILIKDEGGRMKDESETKSEARMKL
jgi:hypothetical protein